MASNPIVIDLADSAAQTLVVYTDEAQQQRELHLDRGQDLNVQLEGSPVRGWRLYGFDGEALAHDQWKTHDIVRAARPPAAIATASPARRRSGGGGSSSGPSPAIFIDLDHTEDAEMIVEVAPHFDLLRETIGRDFTVLQACLRAPNAP